jgi:WD40 repeat protein/tRNA A-37 threonylcarbamoyl transferase component Bud32
MALRRPVCRATARYFVPGERAMSDNRKNADPAPTVAIQTAIHQKSDSQPGASKSSSSGRLEVRCPNCSEPMPVAVDTTLTDLTCSTCGSHFSLVDQSQATRMAPSLSKMGRFELTERLGVGGFGSVWKARDKELDRTVALKTPRQGAMTAEEQEKFFREARAAAQLQHPNIVSVHEVGRDGDNVYIVSDFVRGVTLGDWLTGQQLTNREAAELCAKIADALHHAHENGVVHRDLKPANIMMDYDGEPHLMDFGLARRDVGEVTMTTDGQVLGTPAYMSPEQAEGEAHRADRRSDIYSLGVILFQLLTGELPFRGNARMLIKQVVHDDPPSPRKLNANISKDLETITLKCLEKDPNRRFSTAQDLSQELNRFLSGEPIHSRPISRAARAWRWCRRRPVTAGLSAAVAALVAFVAVAGPVVAVRQARLAEAARDASLIAKQGERNALEAQRLAQQSEQRARESKEAAERLAEAETRARQEAELAQSNLAEAREMAQRISYARTISLAAREWQSANIMQCEDLLDGTRSDLRGWEWDYLKHLCHTEKITLRGLRSMPNRFAFHKDGKHLAGFVFNEERVLVWNLESGQIVAQHPFTGWGISRDGTIAVGHPGGRLQQGLRDFNLLLSGKIQIGQNTGRLSVFNVLTGKTVSHIAGHAGGINFPHLSGDGSKVATTGHQDGVIRVWDTKTGKELRAFKGPVGDPYFVIALSPDGRRIGWKSPDGWLIVHDVASGDELMKARERGNWSYPAFNRDGTLLASGTGDEIAIWDVASGQRKAIMHGHQGFVQKFEFSPTENVLASWGSDNTARLWDVETGRELLCLRGHRRSDRSTFPEIAFNADGTLLATGGSDATIKIWDMHAGDALPSSASINGAGDNENEALSSGQAIPDYRQDLDWLFGHKAGVIDVDFTPDGKSLVSCSQDGTVKLWDLAKKRIIRDFSGHSENAWAVCVSKDGKLVAAGSGARSDKERGKVVVWRRDTGKIVQSLGGHTAAITQLRFASGGKRLVAGTAHQTQQKGELITWDVQSGQIASRINTGGIYGLAISHDDRVIATCGASGQIHVWNADTAEHLRTIAQPGEMYYSVAFSGDGKLLAAGGNSSVATFDVESGSVVWRKFDHQGAVKDVSFAGQNRLLSCGLDGSARLWDVASGESLLTLRDFAGEVSRARMSPDGLTLVCSSDDPRLSLRQLPPRSHESDANWVVLFVDDFERDELGDDWNVVNGKWTIENGVARGVLGREAGYNSNAATIAARSPMPENVEVSYDFRSGAGICVETKLVAESQPDWLIASHVSRTGLSHNRGEKGFAVLILTAGTVFQELARKQDDFTLTPDRTYRIRTVRNEGRLRMFVDETLVLEAEVPDGMVTNRLQLHGVHGARGDLVFIDNVQVRTPKGQAR